MDIDEEWRKKKKRGPMKKTRRRRSQLGPWISIKLLLPSQMGSSKRTKKLIEEIIRGFPPFKVQKRRIYLLWDILKNYKIEIIAFYFIRRQYLQTFTSPPPHCLRAKLSVPLSFKFMGV